MAQGKKTGLYNSKGDHLLEKLEEAGLSEFELEKVLNDETDDLVEGMLEGMRAKWLGIDLSKAPKNKNQAKLENKIDELSELAKSLELYEFTQSLAKRLSCQLNSRFEEFGAPANFNIKPSQMPKGLTFEHLDAIKELYPGAFEPRYLPTAADLRNLDKVYVDVMFPKTQHQKDKDNGLISFRPHWWDDKTKSWGTGTFNETTTKGQVFIASMHHELLSIGGSLVLLDTAIKPNYNNGLQHYGTIDGTESSQDKLLPLFHKVFGNDANRFTHSWDKNATILCSHFKEQIKAKFTTLGLPSVDFDVMLIPAVLKNIELTTTNKVSSTTNTWEWTSTPLFDNMGAVIECRLCAGYSVHGGASNVGIVNRLNQYGDLSVRLMVVFKKGQ